MPSCDVIVLGGGLTAWSAAREAASCGLGVVLCTGSEADARSALAASVGRRVRAVVEQALIASGAPGDYATVLGDRPGARARVDAILEGASLASAARMPVDDPPIEVCHASAAFAGPRSIVTAEGRSFEAPLVVVATDGVARRPLRFPFDECSVCDGDSLWLRGRLPRSVVVVGADAEGCALASTMASIGVPVTVVDRRSRSLRYLDRDLLERFQGGLLRAGVEFVLAEGLDEVSVTGGSSEQRVLVRLTSGRSEVCEALVVVGGREPSTERLRLDRAGVETDERGFVLTDEHGATSQPGVFAAGRVVSDVGLYADEYHGRTVVRSALGLTDEGVAAIPLVVATLPEIAMVGLTGEMCDRLDLPHVDSCVAYGREDAEGASLRSSPGWLKIVVHRHSRALLGVQAVGYGASELVQLGVLLVAKERSARELLRITTPEGSPWASYATAAREVLRIALA